MKFGYLRPIVELEMDDPNVAHPDEIKLSFGTILKVAFKVLGGLIRRKVSFKSLRKVFKVNKQAKKVKKHNKIFPEDPKDFEAWVEITDELWSHRKLPAPPRSI